MKIVFILFPSIFILAGAWGIINRKKCTENVEAEVIGINSSCDSDGSVSRYPVFGYSFGENEYRCESSLSSSFCRLHVGERGELYIDPEDPEDFYCPKETIHKVLINLVFCGMGVFLLSKFIKVFI